GAGLEHDGTGHGQRGGEAGGTEESESEAATRFPHCGSSFLSGGVLEWSERRAGEVPRAHAPPSATAVPAARATRRGRAISPACTCRKRGRNAGDSAWKRPGNVVVKGRKHAGRGVWPNAAAVWRFARAQTGPHPDPLRA